MNDNDRALCAATAHLLRASSAFAWWGLALATVSVAVLALTSRSLSMLSCMGFGATAILGVFERYMALRVHFDARLFDDVGRGTIGSLAMHSMRKPGCSLKVRRVSSGVSTGGGGSLNLSSTFSGPRFSVRSGFGLAFPS